jgi:hypothetical protein
VPDTAVIAIERLKVALEAVFTAVVRTMPCGYPLRPVPAKAAAVVVPTAELLQVAVLVFPLLSVAFNVVPATYIGREGTCAL